MQGIEPLADGQQPVQSPNQALPRSGQDQAGDPFDLGPGGVRQVLHHPRRRIPDRRNGG